MNPAMPDSANEGSRRNPIATVAMVTYDSQAYVAQAIESVLAQTFADFELVICDDRSTDDTWDVVQRCRDPRVRAFRNEANLGEYANRNRALSLARGEYLMYIDGDDYLYPDGLERMVRSLAAHPRAAFAAAMPWIESFIYPVELSPRDYYRCQFLGPNITGRDFTQLLFRTERLHAAGGFDERFGTGDTHIQFLLGLRDPVLLTSDGVAWWRRTPGQASEALLSSHRAMSEWTLYSLELLARPECPLDAREKETAIANTCGRMIRTAIRYAKRGKIAHAWRLLRASGMSLADARYTFARQQRGFLSDRGGRDPLGPAPAGNEPATSETSQRSRRQ